jgi:hypothetical protein
MPVQVAGMNEEQFDTLWKEYMNASAVLLIETDGDPATEAGRRLTRITHESGQLKASMLLSSPDRLHYKLVGRVLESYVCQLDGSENDMLRCSHVLHATIMLDLGCQNGKAVQNAYCV